jgi:8-oxo-dGTP pyrophosphatase MutT (NUDIX family)
MGVQQVLLESLLKDECEMSKCVARELWEELELRPILCMTRLSALNVQAVAVKLYKMRTDSIRES